MDNRLSDQSEHVSTNMDPKDPQEQCTLAEAYKYGTNGLEKDEEKAQYWFGKALKQYQQLAENGEVSAMFELAQFYQYGIGTKQDLKKAAQWYRKAAEAGDVESQCQTGWVYEGHWGVERDDKKSFYWYRKAAEQFHNEAMIKVARCYYEGNGVAQDIDKAEYWFKESADFGNEVAKTELWRLREQREYENNLKKAETGDPEAQYQLAHYYALMRDHDLANLWYRKAAEQGHANAQLELGQRLYVGINIQKDLPEALSWIEKAAAQGQDSAQYMMGEFYEQGTIVERDKEKAREWYEKAANNPTDAILNDKGSAKDKLLQWKLDDLREEAEKGDVSSQLKLGLALRHERGYPRDKEEAVLWYQKAAENGSAAAGYELATCYLQADGVDYDEDKGLKWLKWAAEAKDPSAQLDLGRLYAQGKLVEHDPEQALYWFEQSADAGIPEAEEQAALLRAQIEEQQKALAKKQAEEEEAARKAEEAKREKEAEAERLLKPDIIMEIYTILAGVLFILCISLHHWTEFNIDRGLFTKAFLLFVGAVGSVATGGALFGMLGLVYEKLDILSFPLLLAGLGTGFFTVFKYKNLALYRNVRIVAAVIIIWMIVRSIRKKMFY